MSGSEDDLGAKQIALVSTQADRKRSTRYDAPDEERDANARLLAAAPDLVEALKSLLPALLPDAMAKDKGGLTPESRTRCMAIVKAALSKAGV